MHTPLNGLIILAAAGLSSLAIAAPNGDFSDVKPFPEDTNFEVVDIGGDVGIGFLPSWSLFQDLSELDNPAATVTVAGSTTNPDTPDPFIGGTGAFAFNELFSNYNGYELAQCMPIDAGSDIALSYRMQHNQGELGRSDLRNLRIRLKPYFYEDMEACNKDVQAGVSLPNSSDNYAGARDNFFLPEEFPAGEWHLIDEASKSMILDPSDYPGTTVLRLTISMSNRSLLDGPEPDTRIWLDDIRVDQDGVNRVVNSDFSHPHLKDGDFVTANDTGWQLALSPRNGVTPLAAAGALPFALDGEMGLYLKRLTGEYEDARVVQCISRSDMPSGSLQPSFNVSSDEPASGLMAAVRAEFFTDDACVNEDTLEDLEGELEITGDPRQWQFVQTTDFIDVDSIAGSGSMRLTLSARDRSGGSDAPDGALARTVFIDDVNVSGLILSRPTFSPDGQSFIERLVVTVNGPSGSTLYITTDGTDPDTSSMALQPGDTIELMETTELRAISSDGQAVSEVQSATYNGFDRPDTNPSTSSSVGCSLSGGAKDPVLPMLVVLALIGLARRKWLAKA